MSFTTPNKSKLTSSIRRLRTNVRLVPFLALFFLKASCTLVVINFYMATQLISTVRQSDHDSSLSMMKMMFMHQTERDLEKLEISNTPGTYNTDEKYFISHAIINQTTSKTAAITENERMITPNVLDGTLQGKERLWAILQTRNVTQVNANYWASVPSWDTILHNLFRSKNEKKDPIIDMYVSSTTTTLPSPIIHGLETCIAFQERTSSNPSQRRIAPAGLFNTGTNYLSVLLEYNCQNPHRVSKFHGNAKRGHGNEWEVPWGKHTPASFRDKYTKSSQKRKYAIEEVLPIVMIRNPYSWMKSMCRNPYTARWKGMHYSRTCPQLTNAREDGGSTEVEYNAVDVNYGSGPSHYKSLGHLWNEWYGEYIYNNTTKGDGNSTVFNTIAPFPRLIIRFEDIIFFPFEVTKEICNCAGGILGHRHDDKDVANGIFHYVVRSAKAGWGHGPASQRGLIDSWVRYGIENPKDSYSEFEKRVAQEVLDPWIMETFEYV